MLQSIFHIRGGLMNKKIMLIILMVGFLFCNPVNAQVINGNFETGNFMGWDNDTGTSTLDPDLIYTGGDRGNYSLRLGSVPINRYAAIRQDVSDFGLFDFVNFDRDAYGKKAAVYINCDQGLIEIWSTIYKRPWERLSINITDYTGSGYIEFRGYANAAYGYDYFDNIVLSEGVPPSSINFNPDINITNIKPVLCDYTIHPDDLNYYYDSDTKRVGNTVEIMNSWTSYAFPELPTLWISEGFTDSNESGSHTLEYCDSYNATYDIELRASWYELEGDTWLWHHGRDGLLLASDNITWLFNYTYPDPDPEPDPEPYDPPDPYDPPEIPPPPMPDDWNMTIPDKYQNVTWLTNYTTYFDEMGGTINTTLYSVSGWVISPLTSLNNTVYSLRYYIAGTHDMLNGLSHLHMIVNYGWAVIPIEIKTIFTGTATIGVCIYLFKRRA